MSRSGSFRPSQWGLAVTEYRPSERFVSFAGLPANANHGRSVTSGGVQVQTLGRSWVKNCNHSRWESLEGGVETVLSFQRRMGGLDLSVVLRDVVDRDPSLSSEVILVVVALDHFVLLACCWERLGILEVLADHQLDNAASERWTALCERLVVWWKL